MSDHQDKLRWALGEFVRALTRDTHLEAYINEGGYVTADSKSDEYPLRHTEIHCEPEGKFGVWRIVRGYNCTYEANFDWDYFDTIEEASAFAIKFVQRKDERWQDAE